MAGPFLAPSAVDLLKRAACCFVGEGILLEFQQRSLLVLSAGEWNRCSNLSDTL
jgi:hypothetical protein